MAVGIQSQAFLPVNKRYRRALVSVHISLLRTNTDAQASKKRETISERRAHVTKSTHKVTRSVCHLAVMSDVISAYSNTGCVTSGGGGGGGGGGRAGSAVHDTNTYKFQIIIKKGTTIRCSHKFRDANAVLPTVNK